MKIDLTDLFIKQKELDLTIAQNHNITYQSTYNERIMALLVEISELANASRCFKYWSNKPSESNERLLDEFADGLHFFLSIGIAINVNKKTFSYKKENNNLTNQFLIIYKAISKFSIKNDENSYRKAFTAFLNLIPLFNWKSKDVVNAYFLKLGENYHRQESNY